MGMFASFLANLAECGQPQTLTAIRGLSAFEEYQIEVGDVREVLYTSLITPAMNRPKN